MNRIILKNSVKEIKKSFRRFLSLLLISMLGVGFFAGVKATTPDMQKTIDTYFDRDNLFDIKVVSTLGLTNEDIDAIKNIDGVDKVYASYSEDVFVNINDTNLVVKVIEITDDVNKVKLISGKMPQNTNECVIEKEMSMRQNVQIGDTITIKEELKDDEKSSFKETNIKVVGLIHSPLYISHDKGSSKLGAGKLEYYVYVTKENITEDIYTEIYANAKNVKELNTISEEYSDCVDNVINKIKTIKEAREKARYDSLIAEANQKLLDAENELAEKRADGEKEIADAEKKIKDGQKDLEKAENELQEAKDKAHEEFSKAERQLIDVGDSLNRAEIELNTKRTEVEAAFAQAEIKKAELQTNLEAVKAGITEIDSNYNGVVTALQTPGLPAAQIAVLEATKAGLEQKKAELQATEAQITAGISQIETEIQNGKAGLDIATNQIMSGYNALGAGWAELNAKKVEANEEFDKADKEILDAKKEIEDGKVELADAKKEFDEKIADAENKISDAKQKIADIEEAKWYILDRSSNNGYDGYISDTKNIEKLGNVFPIIFFVIAVLISLTSMSRMVEEQRIELGTMKALGYTNTNICIKYVIYALGATIIGSIIGMLIGCKLIPSIIISMYEMMYPTVNEPIVEFNFKFGMLGLGLMAICTVGATLYTTIKELTSMPSMLMRPKPPKNGKRVFLEKIPFIWNRLNFTGKVTVRNMFRYKKRFLMTIVGIMGCTALILVGFSLKDSISNLMNMQYGNISNYELLLGLNSSLEEVEVENLRNTLIEKEEIVQCTESLIMANELKGSADKKIDIQVIVPKHKEEISDYIKFCNIKTNEIENLKENEILLTEKAANLLNIKVGDVVKLIDNDDNEFEVKVGAIIENYIYHYVYMTKDMYENLYGKTYESNVIYVKTIDMDYQEENKLSSKILENSKIASLTSTEYLKDNISKTLNSLNKVVYVLIVSAGLLAFVVLYNLANVNISERKRELATLKVLGFYDKEVYDYITNEIIVLTIIGILIGLFVGYYLSVFILKTCETEPLIFRIVSTITSYILSASITIIFTIIVNFMTFFVIKKVDMIESLKSVE